MATLTTDAPQARLTPLAALLALAAAAASTLADGTLQIAKGQNPAEQAMLAQDVATALHLQSLGKWR